MIKWLFLLLLPATAAQAQPPLVLQPAAISLQNGLRFTLQIPAGYRISVAAQGLKRPRFFAKTPDGRLLLTDMYDRSDNKKGRVWLLHGWNQAQKKFDSVSAFLSNLHNPNQVAFYNNGAQWYLYTAETGQLTMRPYTNGSLQGSNQSKTIAQFPNYGLSYKYGGWHLTRSLAFHQNKLYVSIGSSCNACVEKEAIRASVVEMNPDGSRATTFASGLRNAVGMCWVGNRLWVTNMGRDLLGPDKPQDQLLEIVPGTHYGWPFYYQYRQKIELDKTMKDSARTEGLKPPPLAFAAFAAHTAPLGLTSISNSSQPALNNKFLVALHGSTSVWRQRGNQVVLVTGPNKYTPFVTGFLQGKTERERYGRPCDVMQWAPDAYFISDDKNGVVYYLWKAD
ncbi:MAG: glucose/sorbosone dehydrogenase [Bacteroidetes bacterium]|nr:MAG: glucose/sorbosone dehydrogenase [Bacteroidota bacterium]